MRHIETQQRFVASLHNEDGDGLPGDPLLLKRERQSFHTVSLYRPEPLLPLARPRGRQLLSWSVLSQT